MSIDCPTNNDDIIDSRSIIARIKELEAEEELDDNDKDELEALKDLEEEASGSPDWRYGETLIRDSYFTEYAQELAEDCGYMQHDGADKWPFTHIDWEAAARELKTDYMSVDFGGVEYWIRA